MKESDPFIGILMLDTAFTRVEGDVGNPDTFNYPVRYKKIKGATAARIVNVESPDEVLVSRFIEAARELEADGAVGLISSCGFLSVLQNQIANSVNIPVILSSLNLIPLMQSSLGHKAIGVITADDTQLSTQALAAGNIVPDSVHVTGMQSSKVFVEFIFESSNVDPDKQRLSQDLIDVAKTLLNTSPAVSILVLECTNLQPYAATLNKALKLPVIGIVNAANLLWEISQPLEF